MTSCDRTILLVEDDEIDSEAVRRALKKAEIDNPLRIAPDGVEALRILNHNGTMTQPCVMLVDINMPRMNGFELLRALRQNEATKQNVVFILTTSNREDDKKMAFDLQAAGYILKDDLGVMAELIQRYCRINRFPTAAHAAC